VQLEGKRNWHPKTHEEDNKHGKDEGDDDGHQGMMMGIKKDVEDC
jgi:hypothetical protein